MKNFPLPLRPYLANPQQDGKFPRLFQELNRAVDRERPAPKKLEAMRAATAASGRGGESM
jgi:hypothetical protein